MRYLYIILLLFSFFIPGCSSSTTKIYDIEVPKTSIINPDLKGGLEFIHKVVRHTLTLYDQEDTKHYKRYVGEEKNARTLYILNVTGKYSIPYDRDDIFIWIGSDQEYRDKVEQAYFQSYEDTLEDEAEYYKSQGLDIYWRKTTSFNSSDSEGSIITDKFMKRDKFRQAFVIAHEMCHEWNAANVSSNYPSNIDESECMVRGFVVAVDYFKINGDAEEYQKAQESFEKEYYWSLDLNNTVARLESLYKNQDLSNTTKDKLRQQEFDGFSKRTGAKNINNARFLDYMPYSIYFNTYYALYSSHDYNMPVILGILKKSPDTEREAVEFITRHIRYHSKTKASSLYGSHSPQYMKLFIGDTYNNWEMH